MQDSILGIDPGLSGAFCLLTPAGITSFWDMPTLEIKKGKKVERQFDVTGVHRVIKDIYEWSNWSVKAYIEWNSVMPGEGILSALKVGEGRMLPLALCLANDIPCEKISPQSWTKALKVSGKKEKTAIDQRYELACRLYPSISGELTTPRGRKLDGRIDALLIAHYFKTKEVVAA
jgi:hypothetical protein